jgi:hypothetical protein
MKKCQECGALIKPFYNLCYNCWKRRRGNGRIPEPIKARDFMDEMGINGWNV